MVHYENIEIDTDANGLTEREARALVNAAEEHESLTRDPPQCPRCGRALARWKRGRHGRIERAECMGCGWYR